MEHFINTQTLGVSVACMFETYPTSGGSDDGLQDAMFIHVVCQILSHALMLVILRQSINYKDEWNENAFDHLGVLYI